jgi:DNA-binding NarL/FixJ family response regulator
MDTRSFEPMKAPAPPRKIHVAIAHHDPYVATGIAALLRSSTDFFLHSTGGDEVDVLVTDYATGMIQAAAPTPRPSAGKAPSLLVVSVQDRGWHIRRAVDAGVRGYLLQDCTASELADAVRCVADGRRYLSRSVADRLLDTLTQASPTARELDVLQHVARGLSNKDIGRLLGIGEGTVKTHVKAILVKLGEPTRTGAIAEAMRRGLLAEPRSFLDDSLAASPFHASPLFLP